MERSEIETITAPFLASDLAQEVRNVYYEQTGHGVESGPATHGVFIRFGDLMTDSNDGPVVLLALVALQLREGTLLEPIRTAALEIVDNGEAARAWRPAEYATIQNRKVALTALADLLR